MNPKDEFIALQNRQNGKITFAVNEHGHVTHIVKRVDLRLYDVFSRLQKIRCVNLPIIIDLVKQTDYLEVHEEYVRGRTVEQARQEMGTLDDSTLLSIAADVCHALIAIHGTQPPIVHRDIKPENIMERENGGYVLIDFDAARIYREDAQTDTKCIATVGYAAPEQYGLSQTDVRSDLFSLGVTLYELKTGESYHVNAKCGGLLGKIITKCTAFEPMKRFQSAQQLLKRIEALQPEKEHKIDISRVCIAALSCTTIIAVSCAIYFGTVQKESTDVIMPPAIAAQTDNNNGPVAQSNICTCSFVGNELSTNQGLIIPLNTQMPVTVQLQVNGTFDRTTCNAKTHTETVGLTACAIDKCSLGANAEITDQGSMTIYAPGAYHVSGFIKIGDEIGEFVSELLIATEKPRAYTDCKSVLDLGKHAAGLCARVNGDFLLPDDGEDFRCEMYIEPDIVDRLCTASEHGDLFVFPCFIEDAPSGAQCGITPDNWFYTNTAGKYQIIVEVLFNGTTSRYGTGLTVDERK